MCKKDQPRQWMPCMLNRDIIDFLSVESDIRESPHDGEQGKENKGGRKIDVKQGMHRREWSKSHGDNKDMLLKKGFMYFLCVWEYCFHVCLCTRCVPGFHES